MPLISSSTRSADVLRTLSRHPGVQRDAPAQVPTPCPVTREELERDLVTFPNKALRQAACDLVRQAGHSSPRTVTSMYRLIYALERLQVSLAWCDELRAGTLLASLPGDESARHREARSSLSQELRACAGALEELCRTSPGCAAEPADQVRDRIMDAAARLLDRLFCEERLLYPPLITEIPPGTLHERARDVIAKLDDIEPLGRRQVLEYLLRAMRGAEIHARSGLLFR